MFYVNSLLEHAKAKQGIHLNELKNIQLTILNEIQELKLKRWGSDWFLLLHWLRTGVMFYLHLNVIF